MRIRLVTAGVRQGDVAARYPMDETYLSKILNGRRPIPDGFEDRFEEVVDQLAPDSSP